MYKATSTIKTNGQESKKKQFQFMILTYLLPWNMLKVIKSGMNWSIQSKAYNQAKFERPPLNSVRQKASIKLFVKSESMPTISFEYMQKWKISDIFITYLTHWTIL